MTLNSTSQTKEEQNITSFSERRRIREQLQRSEIKGESLDPAIKCVCHCGYVHYKPKPRKESESK